MDFNDINLRLERIYHSIGQRSDMEVDKFVNVEHRIDGDSGYISFTFDKGQTAADSANKLLSIVEHIAKLKDHTKNILSKRGEDPQVIEVEIDTSDALKLILDLANQEKHGYPLRKFIRSGRNPRIENVTYGIGPVGDGPHHVTITMDGKAIQHQGRMQVNIDADIVDASGDYICRLSELTERAMQKWEEIIKKYKC